MCDKYLKIMSVHLFVLLLQSLISDSEYRMQKSDIRRVPRKTGPLRSRGRFMCKILKRQNNNVTFDFTELMKEE